MFKLLFIKVEVISVSFHPSDPSSLCLTAGTVPTPHWSLSWCVSQSLFPWAWTDSVTQSHLRERRSLHLGDTGNMGFLFSGTGNLGNEMPIRLPIVALFKSIGRHWELLLHQLAAQNEIFDLFRLCLVARFSFLEYSWLFQSAEVLFPS